MTQRNVGWLPLAIALLAGCPSASDPGFEPSRAPAPPKPTAAQPRAPAASAAASAPAPKPPPPLPQLAVVPAAPRPTMAEASAATCKTKQVTLGRAAPFSWLSTDIYGLSLSEDGGLFTWITPEGELATRRLSPHGAPRNLERRLALPGGAAGRWMIRYLLRSGDVYLAVVMKREDSDAPYHALTVDRLSAKVRSGPTPLELPSQKIVDAVARPGEPNRFVVLASGPPGRWLDLSVAEDGRIEQQATVLPGLDPVGGFDVLTHLRAGDAPAWVVHEIKPDHDFYHVIYDRHIARLSEAEIGARGVPALRSLAGMPQSQLLPTPDEDSAPDEDSVPAAADDVSWSAEVGLLDPDADDDEPFADDDDEAGDGGAERGPPQPAKRAPRGVKLKRRSSAATIGETELPDPDAQRLRASVFANERFVVAYSADIKKSDLARLAIFDCRP